MRGTVFASIMLASAGCTTPTDVSKPLTVSDDPNATATIKDTANGFTVDVTYSRYQFVPETSALFTACRSILTARAYDEAKKRGRDIEPINEQEIRVSAGRNIVNARTKCRAFVAVIWKQNEAILID